LTNGCNSQPPWEFLDSASSFALHSYELSRLSHAANLRKEIGRLLDQWLEENAGALLARWLLERRKCCASAPEPSRSPAPGGSAGFSASHNALEPSPEREAERSSALRFL
jgi:hypothetical protein